jgi:hypothetical protein
MLDELNKHIVQSILCPRLVLPQHSVEVPQQEGAVPAIQLIQGSAFASLKERDQLFVRPTREGRSVYPEIQNAVALFNLLFQYLHEHPEAYSRVRFGVQVNASHC